MAKKITVYVSKSCGGCAELVPALRKMAKSKRVSLKVVDVDKCKDKECDKIEYVPYIKIGGHEATPEEIKNILGMDALE